MGERVSPFSDLMLKAFHFSGFLVDVTSPFHNLLHSYSIDLFVLLFLVNLFLKNFTYYPGSFRLFFFFVSFYLLECISLAYSGNKGEGVFILEKKVSLLL